MLVPGMLRREGAPPETVATRALTDMAEVAGGQAAHRHDCALALSRTGGP